MECRVSKPLVKDIEIDFAPWILVASYDYTRAVDIKKQDFGSLGRFLEEVVFDGKVYVGVP